MKRAIGSLLLLTTLATTSGCGLLKALVCGRPFGGPYYGCHGGCGNDCGLWGCHGCGARYWGDFWNPPPDCCEPCGMYGTWMGASDHEGGGGCGMGGCSSGGCGDGYADGGYDTGYDSGGESYEGGDEYYDAPQPTPARPQARRSPTPAAARTSANWAPHRPRSNGYSAGPPAVRRTSAVARSRSAPSRGSESRGMPRTAYRGTARPYADRGTP